jgi:hypothetical protein
VIAPGEHVRSCRLASGDDVQRIVDLVRCDEGATMAGAVVQPDYQVAMTSITSCQYHLIDILLAGEFVRVYPDGHELPGVLFPVNDPVALLALVDTLPGAPDDWQ